MATFIISALWHGYYPFYFLLFSMAAIFTEICKDVYRARYLFTKLIPQPLNMIITHTIVQVVVNYMICTASALTWTKGMNFMRGTYGCIYIIIFVVFASFKAIGIVSISKNMENKDKDKKDK